MEIYNLTTGTLEELTYYDRSRQAHQQQDSAPDITADDPGIKYNPDEDRYEATAEAIGYWREWFEVSEQADDLERAARDLSRRGAVWAWIAEKVDEAMQEAGWSAFDDVPAARIKALQALEAEVDAWAEEHGYDLTTV